MDKDPWNKSFQIVADRFGMRLPALSEGQVRDCFKDLFPAGREPHTEEIPADGLELFTVNELLGVGRKMKLHKSASPDGIPVEVVKLMVDLHIESCADIPSSCDEYIPTDWKRARLILIQKLEAEDTP